MPRLLKILLATVLGILLLAFVVFYGFFVILLSLLLIPLFAIFAKNKSFRKTEVNISRPASSSSGKVKESFKVIEAEYEIIDK